AGEADRILYSMEAFVRQQPAARLPELAHWPHHHRPMDARPVDGGVGRADFRRQRAGEDAALRLQLPFRVSLVGDDGMRLRVNKEERPAQRHAPESAGVGVRRGLQVADVARGKVWIDGVGLSVGAGSTASEKQEQYAGTSHGETSQLDAG